MQVQSSGYLQHQEVNDLDTVPSGVDFHSGHVMHVVFAYDGVALHQSITDAQTGAVFTHDYKVDIPSILGGSQTGYVGFTAATGGLASVQALLNWTYTPFSS